ncbi:hypothetical protein C8Q73DRAFT_370134 [Cubamyces lactineus]|nr:hypothetical protein C8Q73DRAFT_370134 [Cubamyces lactineus]
MEPRRSTTGTGTSSINAVTASSPRVERHPHLYLEHEAGTVIFLVEHTLFKIHEYFLKRHSIIFASMFTLNPGDAPAEGTSDEHPIPLPDVKAVDFARFLSLFYPSNVIDGDLSTLDEWTSVLRISHRYEFDEYSKLAIQRLEPLATPIDRILLARQYDIPSWLENAYFDLCVREDSLTYDEGMLLGLADVILIAELRQRIRGTVMRMSLPPEERIRWIIFSRMNAIQQS